jgi:hypothetical protein
MWIDAGTLLFFYKGRKFKEVTSIASSLRPSQNFFCPKKTRRAGEQYTESKPAPQMIKKFGIFMFHMEAPDRDIIFHA